MTFEIGEFEVRIDAEAVRKIAGSDDVGAALLVLGQIGEAEAKEHAPVDTGTLRRSITHELREDSDGNQFVRIGTNVQYAVFQEFGTKFHAAHPFMRPAMSAIEEHLRTL